MDEKTIRGIMSAITILEAHNIREFGYEKYYTGSKRFNATTFGGDSISASGDTLELMERIADTAGEGDE